MTSTTCEEGIEYSFILKGGSSWGPLPQHVSISSIKLLFHSGAHLYWLRSHCQFFPFPLLFYFFAFPLIGLLSDWQPAGLAQMAQIRGVQDSEQFTQCRGIRDDEDCSLEGLEMLETCSLEECDSTTMQIRRKKSQESARHHKRLYGDSLKKKKR